MKRALVLGASGGMGYSIVNELISRGVEVTAFARSEKKLKHLKNLMFHIQYLDCSNVPINNSIGNIDFCEL